MSSTPPLAFSSIPTVFIDFTSTSSPSLIRHFEYLLSSASKAHTKSAFSALAFRFLQQYCLRLSPTISIEQFLAVLAVALS